MLKIAQVTAGGCCSYLLFDCDSREAAVVDPVLSIHDTLVTRLTDRKLKLKYIIDTHSHADHLSGTYALREKLGGQIALSEHSPSKRQQKRLAEGDVLEIGDARVRVLYVPGHTQDSVAFVTDDAVLTGDTLFLGTTARTDFPGASPEELYTSIVSKLWPLSDKLLVYPGHDYNNIAFSTLALEKKTNADLDVKDAAAFAALKRAQIYDGNKSGVEKMLARNNACSSDLSCDSAPATSCAAVGSCAAEEDDLEKNELCAETACELARAGKIMLIDVREGPELMSGTYANSIHVPLSQLGQHLHEFKTDVVYAVGCQAGARSLRAQKTLSRLGIQAKTLVGGIQAWRKKQLPIMVPAYPQCLDQVQSR